MQITAGWQIILTALIGAATVGGTWYTLRASRDKIKADTAATLTKSAGEWVTRLDNRVTALETEISGLENELEEVRAMNRRLTDWAKVLVEEVQNAGGVPTPFEAIPYRRN